MLSLFELNKSKRFQMSQGTQLELFLETRNVVGRDTKKII